MTITDFEALDLNRFYTYADYYSWKFQERVELIKGRVFKMSPAPNRDHQRISLRLSVAFAQCFSNDLCEVYPAPFDVRLPVQKVSSDQTETVVQPDHCVISDLDKLDDRGCFGAPDLVVEILSPGNTHKEMHEKYDVYQESGVREYWLVNPLDKNVLIYLLNEQGAFEGQKPFVEEMEITSFIFPGLKVNLIDLFKGI